MVYILKAFMQLLLAENCSPGSIHVGIPHAFDGVLTLSTSNGKLTLSPAVERNSRIISSTFTQKVWGYATEAKYRVRPTFGLELEVGSRHGLASSCNDPGEDSAELETSNGPIQVGYGSEALYDSASTSRQTSRDCCLLA